MTGSALRDTAALSIPGLRPGVRLRTGRLSALSDLKTGIVKPYLIGPGGLIDDAGHVAHAYGQDSLILIRPDGYIGLIADADNALAVADYLRAL
jgi:hypothetical protein